MEKLTNEWSLPEAPGKFAFLKGVKLHALTSKERRFLDQNPSVLVFHGLGHLRAHEKDAFDVIFVGESVSDSDSTEFWGKVCEALAPGGKLKAYLPLGLVKPEDISTRLLLGGFINSSIDSESLHVVSERPAWKPTAALPLKKKAKASNAWKLETTVDADMIDEDALLQEDDCENMKLDGMDQIPIKKKACKNCSCGLADAQTDDVRPVVSDEELQKSLDGCGSCAKGDAFRCGGCPYLGLPSFTPGTKPEIVTNNDGTKSLMLDVSSNEF